MNLPDYLNQFTDRHRICIVGPLLRTADVTVNDTATKTVGDTVTETVTNPTVWVDGGAHHRNDNGFAVGDGDSFDGALDQTLNPDKDFSDLAFVLRRLPDNFTEISLRGFLGGRRDHELFNFGEVQQLLAAKKTPTRVWFDDQVTAYSAGSWQFESHGVFSLAAFAPVTVTMTGACQYPIAAPSQLSPLTSRGLSNIGFGAIDLTADAPAFIFHAV